MKLKTLVKKYNSANLVLRIAFAIVLGALLGVFLPSQKWISEFGTLFVGALKAVAPVLVFRWHPESQIWIAALVEWPLCTW